jgi:hypothetical protein
LSPRTGTVDVVLNRQGGEKWALSGAWSFGSTTLHDPVVYKIREVGDQILNGRIPDPDLTAHR